MSFKKNYLLTIILVFAISIPVFARPKTPKKVYIFVESIESKDKPSFWGHDCDTFYYGDAVEVIDVDSSWYKVKSENSGKSGWVKDSAVTTRKINPKNRISLDANEIALAGKGFSSALEAEYSNQYNKDFNVVDKIEKVSISNNELKEFIDEGLLRGEQ